MSTSDIALRVEGLGKRYRLGLQENASAGMYRYKSLRDTFGKFARQPWKILTAGRGPMTEDNSFWALKDVDFEVKRGEAVGIIGRNGAGKSTLLKILSRITKPTTGRVDLSGRVGSLLEVGTGFHPELSGRENIYLNGAILGMTNSEVQAKFDEIVAFSEIEKFLDTPVKQYSSGMYMRLAFAVAAHLESEILIVDEVLAVGDAEFQDKCMGKMKDVATAGRTVLLVSHNMAAINQLCSSCHLLMSGGLVESGSPEAVLAAYLKRDSALNAEFVPASHCRSFGNEVVTLKRVIVRGSETRSGSTFTTADKLSVEIAHTLHTPTRALRIGYRLYGPDLNCIYTSTDADYLVATELREQRLPGEYVSICTIPPHLLRAGRYSLSVGSDILHSQTNFLAEHIVTFNVEHTSVPSPSLNDNRLGYICPQLRWQIEAQGHDRHTPRLRSVNSDTL